MKNGLLRLVSWTPEPVSLFQEFSPIQPHIASSGVLRGDLGGPWHQVPPSGEGGDTLGMTRNAKIFRILPSSHILLAVYSESVR